MEAFATTARVLRFGVFELDAASGELRRHGQKVRLPDQSFQILRLLLSRPGEVVTRDELRQQLWTSDTFVDFDVGLNSAVRKLREALDDSAENPRFVETLPRRGYRFVASVHPTLTETAPVLEPVAIPPPRRARRARPLWVASAVAAAIVISALALIYQGGWWQRPSEGIRSLAVLPFENLTGEAAQDYLVDGITDALTTSLAQAGGFHVISRTSAMQYRSAKMSLPAIARELNVDAVLEGSVARSGHDVRVMAQLIDAATDRHIWARSYQGELGELIDVMELQQQIGRAIAAALQSQVPSLTPARTTGARSISPEAYDAYLNGAFAMGRNSPEGFRNAVAYFDDVVAREPDFAEGHAALGRAQLQLLFGGPLSPREVIPKAEAAIRRALQLDDSLAQAHGTLGTILNLFYWQHEEAQKEMRRARQLASSNDIHTESATAVLIRAGRFDEAIAQAETASKRDPKSFNAHMSAATGYRAAGQHDRAIARLGRALEIDPRANRAYFQLGITFVMMGRLNDAIDALETAVRLSQNNSRVEAYLGYVYAAAGRPADARRTLTTLESRARQQYVSSFGMALIHDALGEKASALAALERAYADRAVEFAQMAQYPPFKTIASDPRYKALMRLVGVSDR